MDGIGSDATTCHIVAIVYVPKASGIGDMMFQNRDCIIIRTVVTEELKKTPDCCIPFNLHDSQSSFLYIMHTHIVRYGGPHSIVFDRKSGEVAGET